MKVADEIARVLDETPRTCDEIAELLPPQLCATDETVRSTINLMRKQGRAVRVARPGGLWGRTRWKAGPT
jgi:hypothetical protein